MILFSVIPLNYFKPFPLCWTSHFPVSCDQQGWQHVNNLMQMFHPNSITIVAEKEAGKEQDSDKNATSEMCIST